MIAMGLHETKISVKTKYHHHHMCSEVAIKGDLDLLQYQIAQRMNALRRICLNKRTKLPAGTRNVLRQKPKIQCLKMKMKYGKQSPGEQGCYLDN